jgi:hypothetical protein
LMFQVVSDRPIGVVIAWFLSQSRRYAQLPLHRRGSRQETTALSAAPMQQREGRCHGHHQNANAAPDRQAGDGKDLLLRRPARLPPGGP